MAAVILVIDTTVVVFYVTIVVFFVIVDIVGAFIVDPVDFSSAVAVMVAIGPVAAVVVGAVHNLTKTVVVVLGCCCCY